MQRQQHKKVSQGPAFRPLTFQLWASWRFPVDTKTRAGGWKSLRINAWQWKCSCSWKSVGMDTHIPVLWQSNTHTHTHTDYCILLRLNNPTSCLSLRLPVRLMMSSHLLLQANIERGAQLCLSAKTVSVSLYRKPNMSTKDLIDN